MIKNSAKYKAASREDLQRYISNDLVPRLGHLRIDEVTGAEVVGVVEQVGKRSISAAHRAYQVLSVIFTHAVAKHLIKSNPCAGIKPSAVIGTKPVVREPVSLLISQPNV
jgi:hypothetical protein